MAGCCGRGSCSCKIQSGDDYIEITGLGSSANPFVISLANDFPIPDNLDEATAALLAGPSQSHTVLDEEIEKRQGRIFLPEEYGAVADGATDDGVAIRAALAAAEGVAGGMVLLSRDYAWTGDLDIGDGVWMVGRSSNGSPGSADTNSLTALDGTSRIRVGVWGTAERPGGIARLRVDGAGTGQPTGLVRFEGVHAQVEDLTVQRGAGHNLMFNAAQNITCKGVFSTHAGDSALALTNGSGGLNYVGCHFVFSPRSMVIYDDDASANNAYPYGSAHINFFGGIFETSSAIPVSSVVDLRAGANLHFWGVGFSINGATVSTDACVVKVSNPDFPGILTTVGFHSCNFNGGTNQYPAIRAFGTNRIVLTGDTYWQQSTHFLVSDGGSPRLSTYGSFLAGPNVGTLIGSENGGNLVEVLNRRVNFDDYWLPADRPTAFATRRDTDANAGLRMFIDRDGRIAYNDGTSFGVKHSIGHGLSTDTVNISALNTQGRKMSPIATQAVSVAGTAVNIDAKAANVHQIAFSGSGSVSSMTITNAIRGAELEIWVSQDAAGGHTYAWPPNVQFIGTSPTVTDPDTNLIVRLRYIDGINQWVEASRNIIPTGGGGGLVESVNGETGEVVLDANDVGAVPLARTVNGHALSTDIAITKADVGLPEADNTSDADKPISTATQAALDGKEPAIAAGTTEQFWRGDKTWAAIPGGPQAPNTQVGGYTLVLADADRRVEYDAAGGGTITIPTDAQVAFPVGTRIEVAQLGAGQATVAGFDGTVTVRTSASLITRTQNSVAVLYKRAANDWVVSGDLQ